MKSEVVRQAFDLLEPLGEVEIAVWDVGILYIGHIDKAVKIPPAVGKKMVALGFESSTKDWMGNTTSRYYKYIDY